MKCCGTIYPTRKGRFCGACLPTPKRDRDAEWIRRLALMNTGFLPSNFTKSANARLRRIAKRLEGGT